ncbi:thymidine phosphorylase [Occallatibacter riparius]|uniref:thymidine phosphorylase n=1 Tax=Occallatibacter riparius TaxID=1002689 RepID=A0A9J7BMW5_9BACT|nr:thymidine phosphorylase [Occallatibacter riparius]UWZ84072.1 thymidine phosphorylase [Occallatibacter riparius]
MARLHTVDLLRKKRDGYALSAYEIEHLVAGAVSGAVTPEQLSVWLMASFIHGLSLEETRALTLAMRDSGEKFDASRLGKPAVDKHSSGGVGDKTSFLVAPMAAACGLAVPMISGRALGHTGGTLDKLESIPGYRTDLSLAEFESVVARCGCAIVGQTPTLVPADRVLYSLRDRTGTVENTGLLCSSIVSKKLAEGLAGLVLDVKTGSGSSLRDREKSAYLAAMMVAIAEAAGTRTVALLTDMDQPLGSTAGNWIEIAECLELLRGQRPDASEDLRELSLELAGWMIHLGGKAFEPEEGRVMAEATLRDGSALSAFLKMIEAQGGDLSVFDDPLATHKPGATRVLEAWAAGVITEMDTTEIGWAVQRTGAGRAKAGAPVDPHAGFEFHARRGARVEHGQPIATIYATDEAHIEEPVRRLKGAISISAEPLRVERALVGWVFDRQSAEAYLADAGKKGSRD